ncbi:hypothetical protein [Qipengyuania marisflavi]|uniref:Uncharacterized protein n=1 Tax=Qipengyuania marisflavi TaxID=2486356 RepID=A0A5S3P5F0_9SPHN|nr:hypothetical protein [Qipengyuania marisflavi]TMM48146.1 hypothetical protein FEV51_07545 [Qipengyuania marisflavi]
MYEGQFNAEHIGEPRESDVLRRFRWTDLVAKLAATRDLRDELTRTGEGDFSAFADARRESSDESKRPINHDALSAGKPDAVILGEAANCAVQGDRETE